MTTDNKLIKFWPNRILQMAYGSHFITVMHTLCPIYESLVVILFLCHTYAVADLRGVRGKMSGHPPPMGKRTVLCGVISRRLFRTLFTGVECRRAMPTRMTE